MIVEKSNQLGEEGSLGFILIIVAKSDTSLCLKEKGET